MKRSNPLKPGSTLGVCAPSARFDIEKLNTGIQVLEKNGFKVKIPSPIFEKKRYLAGDDLQRATVVNHLFSDPDIDGIICARGGFGAMRILPFLDWEVIKKNPKPFIGFSDNTAILLSIINKTGNMVIHGPNVVSFASDQKETIDSFVKALLDPVDKIDIFNPQIIKQGKCDGILMGGNIATISHLIGTKFQPEFKNAVLLLEDIGEPAYKIDRMLTQMKMAGMFEKIKGVITGSFENCENNEYIEEILIEIFDELNIPVLSGLDAGHGQINLSLRMGVKIGMDTSLQRINWG
ncbi:MAG: LD-carboxypeptidase [Desulfobacteraceae bacterium]|nr:LD-carboxypeptidase [Desulfobacteraceae bacterium]